jgi:L-cysteine S-thiosulfotransferase
MRRLAPVLGLLAAFVPPGASARDASALDLYVQPEKGHCIACHQLPPGAGPATRSDLGPPLTGERMRALGKPGLRAVLEDPTAANPQTPMPPYGRHLILDAREIDRLVEFLLALP